MISLEGAKRVRDKLVARLQGRQDVIGVGIVRHGDGYGVQVNLSAEGISLPPEIDGVPIRTRVIGPVVAQRLSPLSGENQRTG
ncbi:hypothetical protein SAMN05660748_0003 [Blastococcus aggregatus]|uniref:Uncharacterized protein n=1 Tax=Blastococcus aggregatus TaxID=38502 RepID=A0A285VHS9_9ACTN|nr:hypothetical protein [Blastococcus aggregatus]SOC53632.1 hypothetical protein SAMN05660748_0003 [Blastococcus aggregatus]